MIKVNKIDFQGDDLILQYNRDGDWENHVRSRAIIVNWRQIPAVMDILTKLFEVIANKCIPNEDSLEINWDVFIAELKKYEENVSKTVIPHKEQEEKPKVKNTEEQK